MINLNVPVDLLRSTFPTFLSVTVAFLVNASTSVVPGVPGVPTPFSPSECCVCVTSEKNHRTHTPTSTQKNWPGTPGTPGTSLVFVSPNTFRNVIEITAHECHNEPVISITFKGFWGWLCQLAVFVGYVTMCQLMACSRGVVVYG
jgi:hypothetical protein